MSNMGILSLMDAAQPKRQWSVWTDNRYLVSTVMKRYNDQKDYEARCAKRRRGVRSLRADTPIGNDVGRAGEGKPTDEPTNPGSEVHPLKQTVRNEK